jgi:hypothetical protein
MIRNIVNSKNVLPSDYLKIVLKNMMFSLNQLPLNSHLLFLHKVV